MSAIGFNHELQHASWKVSKHAQEVWKIARSNRAGQPLKIARHILHADSFGLIQSKRRGGYRDHWQTQKCVLQTRQPNHQAKYSTLRAANSGVDLDGEGDEVRDVAVGSQHRLCIRPPRAHCPRSRVLGAISHQGHMSNMRRTILILLNIEIKMVISVIRQGLRLRQVDHQAGAKRTLQRTYLAL